MDSELIFWVVVGIASLIALGVLWCLAKEDSNNYVDWIAEGKWK
jgi:hypothetical protein